MSEGRMIVLVTGLSGAGKLSLLRALEDLEFETIDNPPLRLIPELAGRGDRPLAIGVDARTQGFDAAMVLATVGTLRQQTDRAVELVYVWADEAVLLRRYAETRRRHPLAPEGRVADGIRREQELTSLLHERADLVIDTSDLPVPAMRSLVERHFAQLALDGPLPMALTLVSFAYPMGLPRDADLVFDARFLRNPHYDPILRPRTGQDPEVGAYVEADPDFPRFFASVSGLLDLVLPRFVQEGKKYATIAVGCTGGRHRSVFVVERLASHLWPDHLHQGGTRSVPWRLNVEHRALTRENIPREERGSTARRLAQNGLPPGHLADA